MERFGFPTDLLALGCSLRVKFWWFGTIQAFPVPPGPIRLGVRFHEASTSPTGWTWPAPRRCPVYFKVQWWVCDNVSGSPPRTFRKAKRFWGGGLVSDWWLELDNHHKRKVNQEDTQVNTSRSKKIKFYFWKSTRAVCPKGQTTRECQQILEKHTHKQEDFILS